MLAPYLPLLPILSCSLFGWATGISADSKALMRVFQPAPKLLKLRSRDKSLRTRNHPSCTFQCAQRPTLNHYYVKIVIVSFVFLLNDLVTSYENILFYNPPNNFWELSLDKTDHVIQNRTMDIRGYPPSNLISFV